MDGFKIGSARIYQLFSNNTEQSSVKKDASNNSAASSSSAGNVQNTDAVKVSVSSQQDVAQNRSKVEELKQQVQSGQYQKNITNSKVAKSIIEFYSA